MKELEKIADSNGELLEIVDAEAREDISEIKQSLSDLETLEKTVSGAIVTFDDGSDLPMPKLEVAIEPQQDLHGYDYPWAGGAGKNKCPINESTISGATYLVNTDINIASGTWTFSFESAVTTNCALQITDAGGNILASAGINSPSRSATVTINAVGKHLKLYGYEGTYKKIQLESGTTATSFEPYSNICPISGWDEMDVGVSGVNVWDEEWELGSIAPETGENVISRLIIRSKNHILVNPNTAYYHLGRLQLYFYDKDKNCISYLPFTNAGVFTTPNNAVYMRFTITSSYGTTYNNDISINYPSTDTEYHAYNGHTYTIDLDGTRYGGTLDVVSGELVDIIKAFEVDEASDIEMLTSHIFRINKSKYPDGKFNGDSIEGLLCEKFKPQISDMPNNICYSTANGLIIRTIDAYANTSEFINAIGSFKFTYPLATPLTVQLTPTQVKSLLGSNNVWADTGDIKELIYFRNTNSTQAIKDIINTITAEDIAINTPDEMTATNVQEAIDEHTEMLAEQGEDISEIKQSLSNYTNYIFDEVLIGKRQGYNLYRRRMDFSNIQCATGTEVSLGTNVLPSGALNPTISDKSFIKMGNTEQIFSPNNMYFTTYFIGRSAYFRQGFSSSQTWTLVLFVEYALPA